MSEQKDQAAIGKDVLGLVLGALALFLGVSVVMSMIEGFPEEPGRVESVVQAYVGLLGSWPGLALCVAVVVLGVLLFVNGPTDDSPRTLLGVTGTAVGLAVLFGAAADAGGAVGRLGAMVNQTLGPVPALVVGVAAVVLPLWLAWGRALPALRLPAKPRPASNPLDAMTTTFEEGVSGEPEDVLSAIPAPGEAASADEPRRAFEPVDLPPLYPEDVRLKGEIPEGARPLSSPNVPTEAPYPHEARTLVDAPAEGTAAGQPAGPDLAGPRAAEPAGPAAGGGAPEGAAALEEPTAAPPLVPSWERTPEPEPAAAAEEVPPEPDVDEPEALEEAEEPEEGDYEVVYDGDEEAELEDDEEAEDEDDDEEYEYVDDEAAELDEEAEYEDDEAEDDEEYEEYEEEDEAAELDEEDEEATEEPVVEVRAAEAAEEAPEAPEADPEPEVTLQPAGSSAKAPAGPEEPLYVRAGLLILERQRVAVSLLQREFDLDFDQATEVLDRLQEEGLIGPYIGGKSRDILMEPEEWAARVGG